LRNTCAQVVGNDSDHCEAGHKNELYPPEMATAMQDIRDDLSPSSGSNDIDDLAPNPYIERIGVRHIDKFGPMWQFECQRCGEMSDCFDSKDERDKAIVDHQCWSEELYFRVRDDLGFAGVTALKDMTLDDLAWRIVRHCRSAQRAAEKSHLIKTL
jgi:hypothetical protein